jgi:hypothetical protein
MKTVVFLFFMIPVISLGQSVSVDFEDRDLTGWYQSVQGHWCITENDSPENKYSLSHCYNDTVSGTDWIAYFHSPLNLSNAKSSWQCTIRYDYAPSSTNYWAVFLTNNELPDEYGCINNGMVLGVNFIGNSDELMLWRVSDGQVTCLLNTAFNWEDNITSGQSVNLKLVRSVNGAYSLGIEASGNAYTDLGSANDRSFAQFNAFTLFNKYTSTHDQGLHMDNVFINGGFENDNDSPEVETLGIVTSSTIEVQFSEPVLCDAESDWCIDGIGCGKALQTITDNPVIDLPGRLIPGETYTLHLPPVQDVYGNPVEESQRRQPLYYQGPGDVIISEIMADPSPAVMLPEAEYIELFNTCSDELNLIHWILTIGNHRVELPAFNLPAGEYALICDTGFVPQFDTGIRIIPIQHMPALNNTGTEILLQDRSGKLIHAVQYNEIWFESSEKKEGGWSLEIINPMNPCSGGFNWNESLDFRGGTPGERNSVYKVKEANRPPELWRVAVTDTGSLMLYFSEPMDSLSLTEVSYYSVDHSVGFPTEIKVAWPVAERVELFFDAGFDPGIEYEITLTSDLFDCAGARLVQKSDIIFSVPHAADSADIVINEIMFDPEPGLNEYIELYNNAESTIDLRNCRLCVGELADTGKIITTEYWPMLPGTYAVIADGYSAIDCPGIFEKADHIVAMPDMPGLPNSGGTVFLQNEQVNNLDMACYSPDQHHEVILKTKGVSLERISPNRSGIDEQNWHSASADAGYKTPAESNSQFSEEEMKVNLTISPETITPNEDGRDDELLISYEMDKPGYMAGIFIFDLEGRLQYTLANGTLLGTEGTYVYSGRDDEGRMLPTAYYVLFFNAYNEKGDRYVIKRAFVVAR